MGRGGAAGIHNLPLTLSMDDFTSSPTLSAYSVKRVDFLELSYCLTIKKGKCQFLPRTKDSWVSLTPIL